MASLVFRRPCVETVEVQVEDWASTTPAGALEYARAVDGLPDDEEEPCYEFFVPQGPWELEEVVDEQGSTVWTREES